MKTVFVNPERCIGCKQCQLACAVEHSQSKDIYQAVSEPVPSQPRIRVASGVYFNSSFPNTCRHCDPAPCMGACPTGAVKRDADLNMVLVDGYKCITCGMCAMVCPFDVLTFYPLPGSDSKKTVAMKCDQCKDRQQQGEMPACVEACKVGALMFGGVNELVKQAATRLSEQVSVAVGQIKPQIPKLAQHVEAWRQWGETVNHINNRS